MAQGTSTHCISLTPFTAAGDLDEQALRDHLRRLGRSGIGVYVAGSGSGEGYTLSRAERLRVMEIAGEELSGVVPVRVMGVEPRTADEAISLGADTVAVGLDAMQLYSLDMGHGYTPRREELEGYLHTVLDTVALPCRGLDAPVGRLPLSRRPPRGGRRATRPRHRHQPDQR